MNSKQKFHPNLVGNAIVCNDGKLEFLNLFAFNSGCSTFYLSKQVSKVLIRTFHSQICLIKELLDHRYNHFLTARLQSDPIERRFSHYRQMNDRRFLVCLGAILTSEKILFSCSLTIEEIYFWKETSLTITIANDSKKLKSS